MGKPCADNAGQWPNVSTVLDTIVSVVKRQPERIFQLYKGRKPHVDVAEIRRLKSDGMGPTEIAKTLNIGRASVYRALRDAA